MTDYNRVVLVDKQDTQLGLMEKRKAHQHPGVLHRAISVVLWRSVGGEKEMLIQRRSGQKPLWPNYWDSACSTHPLEGESYEDCAVRRLREEMGVDIEKNMVHLQYKLYYQADYDERLSEHELNGILVGVYSGEYELNEHEVTEARWVGLGWLREDMEKQEEQYAPWFLLMMKDERMRLEV